MADLRELYQELIIDHSRSPRNFGKLEPADLMHEGFNPLCGDKVIVYLRRQAGKIAEIRFEGSGCAISMASASMMTEALHGKNKVEIEELFANFHALVTTGTPLQKMEQLEKLMVLSGVSEFPMRVKCATLAWHTVLAAFNDEVKT
jgi:nitrogen fixation protein NifU and related proteins